MVTVADILRGRAGQATNKEARVGGSDDAVEKLNRREARLDGVAALGTVLRKGSLQEADM